MFEICRRAHVHIKQICGRRQEARSGGAAHHGCDELLCEKVVMSASGGGTLALAANLAMLEDMRAVCVLEESMRSVAAACVMWSHCRRAEVVPDVYPWADLLGAVAR